MSLASNVSEFAELYGYSELIRTMQIQAPVDHDAFISRLHQELGRIIQLIESGPKERAADGEDRLTMELVSCLTSAGYIAVKDPTQGGHVDVLVTPKQNQSMRWIGEAKIWNGVEYLHGGMEQLLTRYATGREKHLGFIIYIKKAKAAKLILKWRGYVKGLPVCYARSTECIDQFSFSSNHVHQSGIEVTVRHFGINIFW